MHDYTGATRTDLESIARTVFLWRNDADNGGLCGDEAARQQADTLGFSQFAPINSGTIHACANTVSDTCLNPYLWRGGAYSSIHAICPCSAFARPSVSAVVREPGGTVFSADDAVSMVGGGISSNTALWEWILADPGRVKLVQEAVKERQSLRQFAIDGDYWILSPTLGGAPTELTAVDAWACWQLHRPVQNDGVVTLLRRPNASASFTLDLRGLSSVHRYDAEIIDSPRQFQPHVNAHCVLAQTLTRACRHECSYNVSWAESFVPEKYQVLNSTQLQKLAVQLPPGGSVVVRYTPVLVQEPSRVLKSDDGQLAPPRRTRQPGIITWDTCPCSNASLCRAITRIGPEKAFVFHTGYTTDKAVWSRYDWKRTNPSTHFLLTYFLTSLSEPVDHYVYVVCTLLQRSRQSVYLAR